MLKFYHAPWSRGSGVLWLLEELAVDYELVHIDIRAEEGAPEWYRAVQPNKKVPAIEHDGVVITERAAITVYLADTFPQEGLAPVIGDPTRGPYLSTTVYCDSVFDPCIAARAHGLSYKSNDYSFGLFEDMVAHLERRLTAHPFAAGNSFTAADTQLGSAIHYTMVRLKALPERPAFKAYLERLADRPAWKRAQEKDYALAKTVPAWAGKV
ncbi:glutathione S-transferase family protein [Pseudaminobacter sp. 19-2017]|uniref:Glutathione S-transferase family protein n=1 Tax=Pseudaminobacter soli (ex Zhang et al. 2022) TaxID=2831468 RepID=A0A942I6J7_9HYPH|nr:glutathione S-transferase family protein [Pseudaminobacter soli]MBS3647360.1 glutathione S-transferase family protein [Pseudaminobacter soli]